ncbi:MAG: hypothetical protein KIT73_08990 [Burkholderiales bacterium]|nr:hypothetical protein [Burkholderiales bacterium]
MAARPFVVDDARVVDPGACQVESWFKRNPGSHELWALPSCNVAGFELTAGGGQLMSREPGVRDERDYQFQAKTLFRTLAPNDWGWGVAAGVVRHADINVHQNLIGSYYAYVPVSKSFLDDRIVLLTNVGAVVNRDEGRNGLSWGVGGEFYLTPRFMLLTEIYGATGFDRFSQAGARWWLVPDRVQIDATYGWQWNGGDRTEWITVGLRLISPTFF